MSQINAPTLKTLSLSNFSKLFSDENKIVTLKSLRKCYMPEL